MSHTHGVDSEVGRLRTVLVHRPGAELKRITPRSRSQLLFDRLPWAGRAQQEHDIFTQVLRDRGIEVLYISELLQDVLEYQPARDEAIASALDDPRLGDELRTLLRGHLAGLAPEVLAQVLVAGLTPGELSTGHGVVYALLDRHDFVIEPVPNLVFTRDSSVWISDQVVVTSLAGAGRGRETALLQVLYGHHPRFAGTKRLYGPQLEHLAGGDVLLLSPGVIAVGIGAMTTSAAVERLARQVFDAGLAHTVLAVPTAEHRPAVHLDTVCTVIDESTILMYPALAYTLNAVTITPRPGGFRGVVPPGQQGSGGLVVSRPRPFLEAAAQAMGIDRLRVIDTGLDPLTAVREQWDDGGNALAIGRRVAVCDERNVETNARLEAAGIEVIRVPASELRSGRGGPRCMSCSIARDPASEPDGQSAPVAASGLASNGTGRPLAPRQVPAVSSPRGLAASAGQLIRAR